jgi:hypothetical protein
MMSSKNSSLALRCKGHLKRVWKEVLDCFLEKPEKCCYFFNNNFRFV